MKYIKVNPDRVAEVFNSGRQCFNGIFPVTSLDEALANCDHIYVKPQITESLFAEYVEAKRIQAQCTETIKRIQNIFSEDAKLLLDDPSVASVFLQVGGKELRLTRSITSSVGKDVDEAFAMLHKNKEWMTPVIKYEMTATLKNALKQYWLHGGPSVEVHDLVEEAWVVYLDHRARMKPKPRLLKYDDFYRRVCRSQESCKDVLSAVGVSHELSSSIAESIAQVLDQDYVQQLYLALGCADVGCDVIEEFLQHFSTTDKISFTYSD